MKKLILVIGLLLVVATAAGLWWKNGLSPVNADKTPTIFVVNKGEGVREIANRLKSQKIIRDPVVFFLLTRIQGLDKQIQAGDFRINPSMSAQEVANGLTHGTLDIWVTVPEGQRAEEIANILKQKIPNYSESWRAELIANEGYLFPDTYLIPRDADIKLILSLFKNNFDKKYQSVQAQKTTSFSEVQTIIIASIIEREAVFNEDRPQVASVLSNRLNIDMPLGVDPTIQYAVGYDSTTKSWWKKDLTVDDLAINSPYNTRKVTGLPPTPISNPGLSAIKAALNPANTDYLYFYSDKKGHLHFGKTLQDHEANIKKYAN